MATAFERAQAEAIELRDKLADAKDSLSDLTVKHADVSSQLEALRPKLTETRVKLQEACTERDSVKKIYKKKAQEADDANSKIAALKATVSSQTLTIERLQTDVGVLEEQLNVALKETSTDEKVALLLQERAALQSELANTKRELKDFDANVDIQIARRVEEETKQLSRALELEKRHSSQLKALSRQATKARDIAQAALAEMTKDPSGKHKSELQVISLARDAALCQVQQLKSDLHDTVVALKRSEATHECDEKLIEMHKTARAEAQAEVGRLKTKLAETRTRIDEGSSRIHDGERALSVVSAQLSEARAVNARLQAEREASLQAVAVRESLETALKEARQAKDAAYARSAELEQALEAAKAACADEIAQTRRDMAEEVSSVRGQLLSLNEAYKAEKGRFEAALSSAESLRAEIAQRDATVSEKLGEIAALSGELKGVQKLYAESTDPEFKDKYAARLEEYSDEIDLLKARLAAAVAATEEHQAKTSGIEDELAKARESLAEAEAIVDGFDGERGQWGQTKAELEAKVEQSKAEAQGLAERLEEVETQLMQVRVDADGAKVALAHETAAKEEIAAQLATMTEERRQYVHMAAVLGESVDELKSVKQALEAEKDAAVTLAEQQKTRADSAEVELRSLAQTSAQDHEMLTAEAERYRNAMNSLMVDKDGDVVNAVLAKERDSLTYKLASVQTRASELEQVVAELTAKIERSNAELAALNGLKTTAATEETKLKAEVDALLHANVASNAEITALTQRLEEQANKTHAAESGALELERKVREAEAEVEASRALVAAQKTKMDVLRKDVEKEVAEELAGLKERLSTTAKELATKTKELTDLKGALAGKVRDLDKQVLAAKKEVTEDAARETKRARDEVDAIRRQALAIQHKEKATEKRAAEAEKVVEELKTKCDRLLADNKKMLRMNKMLKEKLTAAAAAVVTPQPVAATPVEPTVAAGAVPAKSTPRVDPQPAEPETEAAPVAAKSPAKRKMPLPEPDKRATVEAEEEAAEPEELEDKIGTPEAGANEAKEAEPETESAPTPADAAPASICPESPDSDSDSDSDSDESFHPDAEIDEIVPSESEPDSETENNDEEDVEMEADGEPEAEAEPEAEVVPEGVTEAPLEQAPAPVTAAEHKEAEKKETKPRRRRVVATDDLLTQFI
ncbi:Chromosome partition protein Smc [Carpediemonas membranifera]|uniref:Chromosome partition protein Smc n=1 Tax=Carpediemonas membranifera TaxID=201153 RepID=A0A8J6E113_9EUKA|nr:Chromosome partition protein Smc [Carpediemonas membranifera]|eukprot:KAG9395769.1 Chromosome partition protein Smc [Carpediemonas membranifera]